MNRLIHIIGIIILFSFSSCEKEIMSYEGQDGIYFDVRWGMEEREGHWAHQYYTPIEFGNLSDMSYTVQIRVTASGTIKNYDRPFSITIGKDSTNAIAGEDYVDFPKEYVLKAGERYAYIDVTFNRTEKMKTDTVTLQLCLQPNEYFTCPFTNYEDNPTYDHPEKEYGYNTNASEHKIVANDMMTKPAGWVGAGGVGLFGEYSAKKWILIMQLTNTTVDDYTNIMEMIGAKGKTFSETLARYLLAEAEKGREYAVLDEDGSMMWCDYVTKLGGAKAWAYGTKPEDYYKGK